MATEIYKKQEIARLLKDLKQKNKVVELMQQMLKNMKIIKEIQEKLVLNTVHMRSDKVSWKSKLSQLYII